MNNETLNDGDSGVFSFSQENCAVMNQEEALIFDNYNCYEDRLLPQQNYDLSQNQLQCKWEDCYEVYENQNALVRHIEKKHVELKRGRYKIINIHYLK